MNAGEMHVDYELRLVNTKSGTGYFGCIPKQDPGYEGFLSLARMHPNDEFLRKHLVRLIQEWNEEQLKGAAATADREDRFLLILLWEAGLLRSDSGSRRRPVPLKTLKTLSGHTPTVFIKSHLLKDRPLHQEWINLFRQNIFEHRPLPDPSTLDRSAPFSNEKMRSLLEPRLTLKELMEGSPPVSETAIPAGPEPEQVHALALDRLKQAGVSVGAEMRHQSSLSPIALLRRWQMQTSVRIGRHDFSLSGELTAYGRGVDFESARAACAMEIVERCSAFASFDAKGVVGYENIGHVISGRASDLGKDGLPVLDPNTLALEAPYRDEPLWWIEAREQTTDGPRPIFVPAQCVFLFCNLDEVKLFSALGSTGLASGVTMTGAKVSALTEVIERDSEGTTPFARDLCFEIETRDQRLAALLESYRYSGIHVQFQDITPALGLPCCKCFVVGADGQVAKGTGAHLDARRALLSALTETTFPYPGGGPSRPAMEGLLRVPVEALPNYASGLPEKDLERMETLLFANGLRVIYIDLTRKDMGLPVVRAIVPGMEILADFDRFSRVHPRLFANYLKLTAKE